MYKRCDQNLFPATATALKKFLDEGGRERKKGKERHREKESLRRWKGLCHRVSFPRKKTNGRRRKWSSREGMQKGKMNIRQSVVRIVHAISMHRGHAGFNIKRFYEPNKKTINSFRLNRREGRQMMYRAVCGLTYNKGLSWGRRRQVTAYRHCSYCYCVYIIRHSHSNQQESAEIYIVMIQRISGKNMLYESIILMMTLNPWMSSYNTFFIIWIKNPSKFNLSFLNSIIEERFFVYIY